MAQERRGEGGERPAVADVYAEPDGTIVLRFHRRVRLTAEQTAEVARAHIQLAHGEKRPVLADVRGLISADRGSREIAAGPGVGAATARLAIIVGNPVTRMLGNFFLKVSTPQYPTRIFSDEAQARAWLAEHLS